MTNVRTLMAACAVVALAILAHSQAPAAVPAAPAPVSLADGYVLGPGDVIEVSVLGRDDFKPRVQVESDGTVTLPLIGAVQARDKTVLALRDDIKRLLVSGGYFAKPEVNIIVATFASRYVTVLGEVTTPGVVSIDRAYHLSEIIARAGGVKTAGANAVTLTPANGAPRELDLQTVATGAGNADPIVNPGDKIFVAPAKTFYIYGQVSNSGTYPIDPDLTIRRALARGGGLTSLGSEKRIKLFRKGQEIKSVSLDEKIQPGDTIQVGERFF